MSPKPGIVRGSASLGDSALIGIYRAVASILGWLVGVARCSNYLRVLMPGCAVPGCLFMVRAFSRCVAEDLSEQIGLLWLKFTS